MATPCALVLLSASRRGRGSWSVPRGAQVAFPQDGFDDPAQAAHRAAAPVPPDRGMFGTVERRYPAFVETAVSSQVRNQGLALIDEDERIGDFALGNGEK